MMRILGITLLAILFVGAAETAPKQMIKIATVAPTGTTWVNELEKTNRELLDTSKGELGYQIYAGGVLGDESDVVRKMRVGQVHAAAFTGMGLGELLPEVRILELPFLAQNDREVDALREKLFARMEKSYAGKGLVLLGLVPAGFVYLFSNSPIDSLESLRKTKMWVWEGDPLARALFQAAGVSGVPLALPDVLTSLQTGLINAVYGSAVGVIALQWHTKVKYRMTLAITQVTGGILVTKAAFQKLSGPMQKLLKDSTQSLCARLAEISRKDEAEALHVLEKSGLRPVDLKAGDRDAFLALAPKIADLETGHLFSADLLQQARTIIADVRK